MIRIRLALRSLAHALRELRGILRELYAVLREILLVPAALLLGAYGLIGADQGRDVMRSLAAGETPTHIVWFYLALAWWSVQSWYAARFLLAVAHIESRSPEWNAAFRAWLPRLLGLAPWWIAARAFDTDQLAFGAWLNAAWPCIILGGASFLFFTFRRRFFRNAVSLAERPLALEKSGLQVTWFFYGSALVFVALLVLILIFYVSFPNRIGAAAIIASGIAAWTSAAALLNALDKRSGLPLLALLILGLAPLFSFWNNNHSLDLVEEPSAVERFSPEERLATCFGEDRGPILFVAAEGGGLRSAYWTALALSAMQDALARQASAAGGEPFRLNRRIYALSGVSGGALGISAYAALAREQYDGRLAPEREGAPAKALKPAAIRFLGRDSISPVVAGLIYPDLVQRFLPVPIESWDRARFLENAWRQYWNEAVARPAGTGYFDRPFLDLYAGGPDDPAAFCAPPALILNATHVQTGRQIALSPLRLPELSPWPLAPRARPDDWNAQWDATLRRMRLSTGALASARFPYITPGGRVYYTDAAGEREAWGDLVDGGYAENTGLGALASMLARLQQNPRFDGRRAALLILTNQEGAAENQRELSPRPESFLSELRTPPAAFMKAWSARSPYFIDTLPNFFPRGSVFHLNLYTEDAEAPVGWFLSRSAQLRIQKAVSCAVDYEQERCDEAEDENRDVRRNACHYEYLRAKLTGIPVNFRGPCRDPRLRPKRSGPETMQ